MGGRAVWRAAARGMQTLSSQLRCDSCRCHRVTHSGKHAGAQSAVVLSAYAPEWMHACSQGLAASLASCAPCCRCQPWRRCWPSNRSCGKWLLAKQLLVVTAPPAGCQIPGRAQHRPPPAWVWPARLTVPAAIAPVPGCCSRLLSHMQPLPRTPAQCLQRHLRRVQHRAGPGQLQLAAGLGGPRTGLSCRWRCATQWRPCWRQPGCVSPAPSGAVHAPARMQPVAFRRPPGGRTTAAPVQQWPKQLPRQVRQRRYGQADVRSCTAPSVPANARSGGAGLLRSLSSVPCRL